MHEVGVHGARKNMLLGRDFYVDCTNIMLGDFFLVRIAPPLTPAMSLVQQQCSAADTALCTSPTLRMLIL